MSELKPCPFCGGMPELIVESLYDETGLYATENYYSIACTRCFARSGRIYNKEKAKEAWNRRTEEDG